MAEMTRSDFLRLVVGAGAGALGLGALTACGDDGGGGPQQDANQPPTDAASDAPPIDAPPAGNCEMNGTTVQIGSNHGHVMTVPKDDIAAGADKTYSMQGSSGHNHTITVTAAMFAMLAQNMTVTGTSSSDDSHTHSVTIRCA